MPTREERLAALLAQPERDVVARRYVPGLLEEVTPQQLQSLVTNMISTQAAGAALYQARQQREWSLRQAGEASGRSAPRIKAIEDTGTDINLGTVVEHAQALGYRVQLVLTPMDHRAATIQADLSGEDAPSEPSEWASVTTLPVAVKKKAVKVK